MVSTSIPKGLQSTQTSQRRTGAFALMDSLRRHGVKHIFGYPGGAILPIYDELYHAEERGEVQHILVRHEQAAAHAADGYARATGKVGVCFATSGPGATNLVTGIATAYMDSIPMVAITGQVTRSAMGTDAFQEVDIFGITMPIVKNSYVVHHAKDMARIVAEAFYIASTGRTGPVLIDIPKDVSYEEFDYVPVKPGQVSLRGYSPTVKGNPLQISAALKLIKKAEKPLMYVGGGAVASYAHGQIKELAERFKIPVTTTLMGLGSIDEHNPLSVGMLGMHGTAYANFAVSECDLLIAIGARFDDRVTGKLDEFANWAKVIHIDIDPAEIGKNRTPEVPIVGDVGQVLEQMLEQAKEADIGSDSNITKPWLEKINHWREEYPLVVPHPEEGISPQEVIVDLNNQAPYAFYTTDVGQHQMWAAQFLKHVPRRWISSAGLGTMGYGLAAAMGSKVAIPEEETICISGDASFQMNPQELGTLTQFGINVKTVIINNGWQGMVRQQQQTFYGSRYSSSNMEVGTPDFKILAKAYSIKGMSIKDRSELAPAIAEMLAHDGPVLMEVKVTKEENCYPMIVPGKSNSQMLGLPQKKCPSPEFINCTECGTINPTANKFCPECSSKLHLT